MWGTAPGFGGQDGRAAATIFGKKKIILRKCKKNGGRKLPQPAAAAIRLADPRRSRARLGCAATNGAAQVAAGSASVGCQAQKIVALLIYARYITMNSTKWSLKPKIMSQLKNFLQISSAFCDTRRKRRIFSNF
jgi:hypothetical protein